MLMFEIFFLDPPTNVHKHLLRVQLHFRIRHYPLPNHSHINLVFISLLEIIQNVSYTHDKRFALLIKETLLLLNKQRLIF